MDNVDRLLADYGRNFPAFEQQEEGLEQDHLGEFAVFCDGRLVGVYETPEEADAKGADLGEYTRCLRDGPPLAGLLGEFVGVGYLG